MRTLPLTLATLCLTLGGLWGCQSKSGEDKKNAILSAPAACETDKDCADGFICTEKKCLKGQRSAEELAAERAKKAKEKAAAAAKKKETKPGEGRLTVRICPGFKNTPEAIGTIVAVHQETKKRKVLHMATEAPELGWQMEFTFYSLPLGTYDVTANYGIQKGGVPDTVWLKCDKKAKPCREEPIAFVGGRATEHESVVEVREIEVVLPENEPPREKNDKGEPKLKACDFVAE